MGWTCPVLLVFQWSGGGCRSLSNPSDPVSENCRGSFKRDRTLTSFYPVYLSPDLIILKTSVFNFFYHPDQYIYTPLLSLVLPLTYSLVNKKAPGKLLVEDFWCRLYQICTCFDRPRQLRFVFHQLVMGDQDTINKLGYGLVHKNQLKSLVTVMVKLKKNVKFIHSM
jgi:hypothetical protein